MGKQRLSFACFISEAVGRISIKFSILALHQKLQGEYNFDSHLSLI
jgi:hypothetical protein